MNTVAYLRVSTDQQDLSLEVQLSLCNEYARQKGWTITHVLKDNDKSGELHFEDRPALSQALDVLKKGDIFLIAKRDRLSRNMTVAGRIEYEIEEKRRASIVSANPKEQNIDQFMQRILDAFAEKEKHEIRDRIKVALRKKKENNERLGRIPIGKKVAIDGIHLEENPQEQKLIRKIKRLHKNGLSIRKIMKFLNAENILNDNKLWTHDSIFRRLKV